MYLMPLSDYQLISGVLSMILVAIYIIIGLSIFLKYFKVKQRVFIYMGLAWITLSILWWSSIVHVILLILNPNGSGLPLFYFFIIASFITPLCVFLFATAFTSLTFKKYKRHIQAYILILALSFWIILIFYLSNILQVYGISYFSNDNPTDLWVVVYLFVIIITLDILGILFALDSIKSENKVIKNKGRLILIAFILFAIGAFFDGIETNLFILEFLDRFFLITSVIFFYFGFIMPDWLKVKISEKDKI